MSEKKEFELNLQSPAFTSFNGDLNAAIINCLRELHEGNFAGGDIAAKISIELQSDHENFAVGTDDKGKPKYKAYRFKKPDIEYKVTLTLKKRNEIKGSYNPDSMELKQDKGKFILSEVTKAQLTLYDVETDVANNPPQAVTITGAEMEPVTVIVDSLGKVRWKQ